MPHASTKKQQVLDLLRTQEIANGSTFESIGVSRSYLYDMAAAGDIANVGRGLFSLTNQNITTHHSFAETAAYIPHGVICLLSALQFHEIGTQLPPRVWVALKAHSYVPKHSPAAIEVIFMGEKYLNMGLETHILEGVPVRITSIAKTVVDCFKYKRNVGLDVCLEALKDVLYNKRISMDEIYNMAMANRVGSIVRPYLEALV
jgi:predicted transcriptional regulator of viral defense system